MLVQILGIISAVAILAETQPIRDLKSKSAKIVRFQTKSDGLGRYKFLYETTNNIQRQETGEVLNPGSKNPILVIRGFYSYIDDDGKRHEVRYVADEKGFQPEINVNHEIAEPSQPEELMAEEDPAAEITTEVAPITSPAIIRDAESDIFDK